MKLYNDDTRPYIGWDDRIKAVIDTVPEMRQVFPAEPPSMNAVYYARQPRSGAPRLINNALFASPLDVADLAYTDTHRKHARNVCQEGDFFYSYDMLLARVYPEEDLTLFARPPTPTTRQHLGLIYRGRQHMGLTVAFDSIEETITTQDVVRTALMAWHSNLTKGCRARVHPVYELVGAANIAANLRAWLGVHDLTYHIPSAREVLTDKHWARLVGLSLQDADIATALRALGGE